MGYDRGESFPFDFEPNEIPFGSKSKGKLSPYPIQCERKCKYSFLSVVDSRIKKLKSVAVLDEHDSRQRYRKLFHCVELFIKHHILANKICNKKLFCTKVNLFTIQLDETNTFEFKSITEI